MSLRLGTIVDSLRKLHKVEAELIGDSELQVSGLATLDTAGPSDLAFLNNPKYLGQLTTTSAGCVVVAPSSRAAASSRGPCIVTADPYYYFALLTQLWKRTYSPQALPFIHPTACIDPAAVVAVDASVAAYACIGAGAQLGSGVLIGEHCVVGANAIVSAGSHLYPRVTVGADCRIGERCILHSGVVIGADGFGFALHDGAWVKIEQLGAVRIGNDVEVGANSCIDRGALQDTVIENGVKLDNLVQIGHNVRIGQHSAMAGCVGVAGSATIGANCTVGGGGIVLGHLQLVDGVHVSAASTVTRSLLKPGHYTGLFPIDDNAAWGKNAATLKQLNRLRERLKLTEKALIHLQGEQKEKP